MLIRMLNRHARHLGISDEEKRTMWRCVYLHFEHRMPYVSIARELGIPRTKVSDYVEAALDADLIKLNPPRFLDLETKLQDQFQMRAAVVAVPRRSPPEEARADNRSEIDEGELSDVGSVAAGYLESLILTVATEKRISGRPVEVSIGVACGRTVQATIEALDPRFPAANGLSDVPLLIYPLSYSSSPRLAANSPNAAVAVLNSKWAGGNNLTAFTFHGNAEHGVSEESMSHPVRAGQCDISILGIGSPGSPSAHSRQLFEEAQYRIDSITTVRSTDPNSELSVEVDGEINGQPFSAARFQDDVLPNLFGHDGIWRGVHWRQLRELSRRGDRYVIAVACGRRLKGDAISIALSPHLRCFNVLVTDDETAEYVLRKAGQTDFVPPDAPTRLIALS